MSTTKEQAVAAAMAYAAALEKAVYSLPLSMQASAIAVANSAKELAMDLALGSDMAPEAVTAAATTVASVHILAVEAATAGYVSVADTAAGMADALEAIVAIPGSVIDTAVEGLNKGANALDTAAKALAGTRKIAEEGSNIVTKIVLGAVILGLAFGLGIL